MQRLLARYGLPSIEAAVGRSDLLEQVKFDGNLDLQPMLAKVSELPGRWMGVRNDQPMVAPPLDEAWVAATAIVKATMRAAPARGQRGFASPRGPRPYLWSDTVQPGLGNRVQSMVEVNKEDISGISVMRALSLAPSATGRE